MFNLKSLALLIGILCFGVNNSSGQSKKSYLCVFMDGTTEDLRYCISTDGYHFTAVNGGNTIIKSTIGGKILRDPQIIKDKNGLYHLIATNSWKGRSFALWDSSDLIHWENERLVSVSPDNADKTWAPEAIYDEDNKNYILYWTSSLDNDDKKWAIYSTTTRDFKEFTAPKILMQSDYIILDASIVKYSPQKSYMFYRYKNQIWRKEANKLSGKYRDSVLVVSANVEGPYVYKIGKNKWNMIWDYYGGNQGKYGMAQSSDLLNWKWLTDEKFPYYNSKVVFPAGVRHGAILAISSAEYKRIKDHFAESSQVIK